MNHIHDQELHIAVYALRVTLVSIVIKVSDIKCYSSSKLKEGQSHGKKVKVMESRSKSWKAGQSHGGVVFLQLYHIVTYSI